MKYLIGIFFLFSSFVLFSQLKVAEIFSDDMVIQRDTPFPVWGWADKGSKISIIFNGQTYRTHAPNGKWKIMLPARPAGKRYGLAIKALDTIIPIRNITFGDVWLCAGQSNMEWHVEAAKNGAQEVAQANYPNIRIFDVPHKIAKKPATDIEPANWQICDPKTINQFSAVGYFFGRELHQELKIPIGLIGDNFGGTVIETWMSQDAFQGMPVYEKQIQELSQKKNTPSKKEIESKFKIWLDKFSSEDKGKKDSVYFWQHQDFSDQATLTLPNQWESAGIDTLKNLDGVVWLEKEFTLTAQQASSKSILSLGPIDDSDITWINGIKVGGLNSQWNKNRTYDIPTNTLKIGKNKIVIRVEDYLGGGGLYGKSSQLNIIFKPINKPLSLAGKWHYKIGYHCKEPMPSGGDSGPNSAPTLLYNGMIAPIVNFPIKGVIWYQGESNSYRAVEYKSLKIKWIDNWRKLWKDPTLPMIWVQLANYQKPKTEPAESSWAELREAQEQALSKPHTGMITAIDIGSATTIHPLNKQEVGHRLAQAALEEVYPQPTNYKSPRFLKIKKRRRRYIDILIKNTGQGLQSNNKNLHAFSVAGKDQVFRRAKAKIIKKNVIRVYCPKGIKVKSIRYAWAHNPEPLNITNSFGYPLLPFRTDHWILSTDSITRQ